MWYLRYEMLLVLSFSSTMCAERIVLVGVQCNTSGLCGCSGKTVGNFRQATTSPCNILADHTQVSQSQPSAQDFVVRARGGVVHSKSGQRNGVGLEEASFAVDLPASCPWTPDRASRAETLVAACSSSNRSATRLGSSPVWRGDGFIGPEG